MVLSYSGFVFADTAADQAETDTVVEKVSSDDQDYDNDELAEQYIMQEMSVDDAVCYAGYNYVSVLGSENAKAYNYLRGQISKIAGGEVTSTVITLPDSFTYTYSASQLGMTDLKSDITLMKTRLKAQLPISASTINKVLRDSCPFDMYWYDKEAGCYFHYDFYYTSDSVTVYNLQFSYKVEKEYQYMNSVYSVNPAYGQSVKKAAATALGVINTYDSLSDYDKLKAYNDWICDATDYNNAAAADSSMPYGNPWQLVWVFDGDSSTKVVCEGYAKAFQYLCDSSRFNDSGLYVLSMSGVVSFPNGSSGGHMWNIVHIGGANYLMDVTNNDSSNNKYFLIGASSGSVNSGYTVSTGAYYTYEQSIKSLYPKADLTLSGSKYDPSTAPSTPASSSSSSTAPAAPGSVSAPAVSDIKLTSGVAHVQDVGNVNMTADPTSGILTIGTTGQGKRLESITINFVNNTGLSGNLEYRVHVQDIGWMDWVQAGQAAGTQGLAKRIEAIEIRLTDELGENYSVEYCVHIQDYGDMQGWVKDGALAGTTGESKRIEELKIKIVPKGSDSATTVMYRVHVQDLGWEKSYASNGAMSGTSGQSKRLEGIEIFLSGCQYKGGIKYKTHVQDYGWEGKYAQDGEMSGTQGEAKRLEGICIELYGEVAEYYDVYYRVHAQDIGWLSWACNGDPAGTAGRSARLEGIQIVLVPKGSPAPGATYMGITSVDSRAFVEGF